MAEVYGNIGNETVELNNAATEATLKALLEVARSQGNQQSSGKGPKELEKNLLRLAKQTQNTNKAIAQAGAEFDDVSKSVREARKAYEEQTFSIKKLSSGVSKVGQTILNAAANINEVASQISRMGNSMSAATAMLRHIPVAGEALSSMFGAIAGAVETTQKSFMDISSIGANFGGSMEAMIDHATAAGLTIDQFSSIIQKNGEAISFLADSSSEGARRFTQISAAIRKSGVQDQLAYLGYNTEDINEGLLKYSVLLQRAGVDVRNIAPARLAEMTGEYLTNLDAVSKLTGRNRKDLENDRQERQRDLRVRVIDRKLKTQASKDMFNNMLDISKTASPALEKAFRDLFYGIPDSPEAQAFLNFNSEAGQLIMATGRQAFRTGELTTAQADQMMQAMARGSKALSGNESMMYTLGANQEKFNDVVVGITNLEQFQGKSLAQITKQQQDEYKKRKSAAKDADPASILRTQQQLAIASNEATEFLVKQTGILTSTLDFMSETIGDVINYINGLIDAGREGGFAGIMKKVTNDMWDVFKDFMNWLWDSLASIGDKLGKALWNSLPQGLRDWFTEGKDPVKEKENEIMTREMSLETAKKQLASREREIANLRPSIKATYQPQIDAMKKAIEDRQAAVDKAKQELADIKKAAEAPAALPDPRRTSSTSPQNPIVQQTIAAENLTDAQLRTIQLEKIKQEQERLRRERERRTQEMLAQNTQANVDNTRATTNNTNTVEAASTCELDYSSPQALFNSFVTAMSGGRGAPGAPGTTATGAISGTATTSSSGGPGGSYSDIIGHYEGAGKYDTVFGQAGGAKINNKLITENTIAEVIEWQKKNRHTNRHAAGKYGFIDVADVAKEAGIAADALFNAETQEKMQQAFTRRSARVLERLGIEATNENLSLAHSVGPGGAQKLLNAQKSGQGNLIAADVLGLSGAGRTTNPQLMKPVAEVLAANARRFQTASGSPANPTSTQPTTTVSAAPQAPAAGGTTPTNTQVVSAVTPQTPPAGGTTPSATQVAAAVTPEAPKAGATTPNVPGAAAPAAGGAGTTSNLASLMEDLNSNVRQLVALTNQQLDVSRRTLNATKNNSSDLYRVVT